MTPSGNQMANRENKHEPKLTGRLHERRENQNPEEGSGVGSWIRAVHQVDPQEKGVSKVSEMTNLETEASPHWSWVETTIWIERMLAALGNGVKGDLFFAQLGLFTMKEARCVASQSR